MPLLLRCRRFRPLYETFHGAETAIWLPLADRRSGSVKYASASMSEPQSRDQAWLERFISVHGGVAGTVHRANDGELQLTAAHNIPPPVQAVTARVPRGKGMAGLAWEREVPVQTCNLKTDTSGDVRPGARAVNAQAAVALPVRDGRGEICAVVGIAFAHERELPTDEVDALQREASSLATSDTVAS